ncbi:MAG: efflux RND transporter periplasmic adaptor subunit [Lachnospiraceae bacterium]|nr:efflux RND transporter periplasmic adaptor subunit [Lachnospiraceae bacterium]
MEKKEEGKVPMDQSKKKKIKKIIRRIIIGVILVAIIAFIAINSIMAKNAPAIVYVTPVERDDVEQVLSTSGTVKTEEKKVYFSTMAIEIAQVNVALGDNVKKEQALLSYDADALENEKLLAQLRIEANEGSYASSISKNNEYINELGEANFNLDILELQIAYAENNIKILNKKITDKQDSLAKEGTNLQISLIDWSDEPDSEEYMELQKQIQKNSYEQQHNKEIEDWQSQIETYQETVTACKEYKAEMESQKTTSENSILDSGSKEQMSANRQIENINATEILTSIEEIENGIFADFDGVVTELNVVEGDTPMTGAQMLVLESTEKVKVEISVSKYDLEKIALGQEAEVTIAGNTYNGVVSKINGMATTNASGASVVGAEIQIKNPDSNIFLGVEAKVKINTSVAKQVLVVPIEVVNSDKEGDFVYVVEDGVLMKRSIVTGISSDSYCEVKEGLNEGDQVVSNVTVDMVEGMTVTAVSEY